MGSLIYLVGQEDIAYLGFHKDLNNDERTLSLFARITNSIPEDSIFDALKSGLRLNWKQTYDTVNPFGDSRQCLYCTMWIFDFIDNILILHKKDSSRCLPLFALRQHLVTLEDFEQCDPATPLETDIQEDFPPPYWDPAPKVSELRTTFIRRLLQDLNFQWRSILRNRYNQLMFQKLVRAVLRIAILDFNIVEYIGWRHGQSGALVGMTDLPEWEPISNRVVPIGNIRVIAAQDPQECIALIRSELNAHQTTASPESLDMLYLVISLRHIVLCRYSGTNLEWTQPEPFLNGQDPVSDQALNLLLSAIPTKVSKTAIHMLPIEIQDRILRHISQGPIEPAKIGCILGLGSPFTWKDGEMVIESVHYLTNRTEGSPVESQIWFGDHMSGISYRGNIRTLPGYKEIGFGLPDIKWPLQAPPS